jgi:hypothetical protein
MSYLLGALLPQGGYVVNFAMAWIDESGSHQGSPVLCLAGFLYEREHSLLLENEWRAIFARENMSYMRMSEFTKPGHATYAHLDMPRREAIQRELIDSVQRHRTLSFASIVNEPEFNDLFKKNAAAALGAENLPDRFSMAYTNGLIDCLVMIRTWADANSFVTVRLRAY